MKEVVKKYDIAVIIGRFQIHELHTGHKAVIEHVLEKHDRVVIFLGVSPAIHTRNNPLDYTSRKKMIEETYGDRIEHIQPLHDMKFNCQWAKQVDTKIRELYPIGSVVLYGSRKSFIESYVPHGKFDTIELEAEEKISATEVRLLVKITPLHVTNSCVENDIKTTGGYDYFTPYKPSEEALKEAGFDVLVFIPSRDEDEGLITCGNAILSGSVPTVDFEEIRT